MPDYGDSDSWRDSGMRRERLSRGGHDLARLLKGAAFGAVVGAAFVKLFGMIESDDEPPIRVKGGSSEFELLDPSIYWVDEGSKKKWRLSDGTKNGDEYKVVIRILGQGDQSFYGRKITVYVGANQKDEKVIELKANNQKTKLSSNDPLDYKGNNKQVLTHPLNISKIKLDGGVIYDPATGTLDEALIYG